MKYSADQKLFFVHIPKCAGLSIYRGLDAIAEFPWASFARDNKEAEAAPDSSRSRKVRLPGSPKLLAPSPISETSSPDFPRCLNRN